MRPPEQALVVRMLREPQHLASLNEAGWTLLVRQARRADVLARVAALAERQGAMPALPPAVRGHLADARRLSHAQQMEVRREVEFLARALAPIGVPVTLMKGAAYLMAGRSAALGRMYSDVDIIVPKSRLGEVEAALMLHGWAGTHHSAYDQRYYRVWMHELPPMLHLHRQTVVDVHHAILPETARLRPDPARILAAARPLPDDPRLQVLAPADMVLHSMTHLFHNEEMSHGLRDLSDLDMLLRELGAEPGFWAALQERAAELMLTRPLYHGLRHAVRVFGTPVPPGAVDVSRAGGPGPLVGRLMDALWARGLAPQHATAAPRFTAPALGLIYLRAHALRMPLLLLARHLLTKAAMRREPPREAA